MTELTELHLSDRLAIAKSQLVPVQSDYRVVFEPDIDTPSAIMVPDPNWLAAAMAGGYLPDIEAYLTDKKAMSDWMKANPNQSFSWDRVGGAKHPYAPPRGPMTEEEAIEYLIQKDLPDEFLQQVKSGNSIKLVICRKDQLPDTREWRDAWKIDQTLTIEEEAA